MLLQDEGLLLLGEINLFLNARLKPDGKFETDDGYEQFGYSSSLLLLSTLKALWASANWF